jgi:predicted nuclease of restriction endonuclease-like RecB superfamily
MENEIQQTIGVEESYIETEAEKTHYLVCKVTASLHKNFIDLAILLKVMRDKELYRDLDYESFDEYCSIPEIDLSRSQVFKLISVYERWIERYGHKEEEIQDISIEKLYIASSQANDENQEEWLEKARTLSRDDLKDTKR